MILIVAALLIVGVVVLILLVRPEDIPETGPASPVAHLEARRDRIAESLRDLQFEFRVGKLSEKDYEKTRTELERDLDRLTAEIDRILGKRVENKTASPPPAEPSKQTGRVCPHCGARFERELRFCGECGQPMKGPPA